ncbi:hypothetical protein PGH24_07535 [Thermoanaerobacterium thermosaccharolyticum]|uniref:hypothetical protein n=1 Tax=Thermoanaerobacterium thermosaccharolyticum TaxID=1517 RepID=UPI0027989B9E|nr:hypothetical protein PGH24_07535 [Thermoanaerobacterium thermosaccharolyticum]
MEIEILLKMAIKLLYIKDSYLLEINVNERAITHRLAMYLQMLFTDYDVDCEYNRDFRDKKNIKFTQEEVEKMLSEIKVPFKEKIKKFLEEDNEDYLECSVYPDIIIHKRNSNNNLLAIEVKKQNSNEKDDEFDELKLKKYTDANGLSYEYGVFIKLGKTYKEKKISWYKNGMPIIII